MSKRPKRGVSQEDSDLFRNEVAGTRRYQSNAPPAPASKPPARLRRKRADESAPADAAVDDTHGDHLRFARTRSAQRALAQLQQGGYEIDDAIDLHGCTAAEATRRLAAFLAHAQRMHHRCLLIVHGKGIHSIEFGGVLKQCTADWLKRQPTVKAFCSAQPRDGGTGAVYVLL